LESIGHMSGDAGITRDFLKLMQTGELTSRVSLMSETIESHMNAFAAEESRKTGKEIDTAEFRK
ncbi:MAG: gfo/Idh/MocA family oxidoreductase, partial [Clostridia bacterium]